MESRVKWIRIWNWSFRGRTCGFSRTSEKDGQNYSLYQLDIAKRTFIIKAAINEGLKLKGMCRGMRWSIYFMPLITVLTVRISRWCCFWIPRSSAFSLTFSEKVSAHDFQMYIVTSSKQIIQSLETENAIYDLQDHDRNKLPHLKWSNNSRVYSYSRSSTSRANSYKWSSNFWADS